MTAFTLWVELFRSSKHLHEYVNFNNVSIGLSPEKGQDMGSHDLPWLCALPGFNEERIERARRPSPWRPERSTALPFL